MTGSIAMISVSYYSTRDLDHSIRSARAATSQPLSVFVVNNAQDDTDIEAFAASHPDVELIEAGSNLGYGRALNLAVDRLDPEFEWVLVVNPDTEFTEGSIDEMLRVAHNAPDAAAFGPRILDSDGSVYPSARALPSLRVGAGHALLARFWPDNRFSAAYRRADLTSLELVDPTPTGWLSGACLLIRRDVYEAIGGFDDRFFMYFEDVDLGKRIGERGALNLYVPTAVITHVGGQSTRRNSRRMIIVHHRSAYLYLQKKYEGWYLWPLRVALRIALAARARISSLRRG
jgi:N-acetylglucosaminyl-diphospho-decaprenol L-rhamnosyltransferase